MCNKVQATTHIVIRMTAANEATAPATNIVIRMILSVFFIFVISSLLLPTANEGSDPMYTYPTMAGNMANKAVENRTREGEQLMHLCMYIVLYTSELTYEIVYCGDACDGKDIVQVSERNKRR